MSDFSTTAPRAPREPSLQALKNPLLRYLLATRPAFLTITLAGCLLGFSLAPVLHGGLAALTLLLALLAHAGVNVLNDYYDHLNGTDAANTGRLFPFTGGSRFIQNGVLSPRQTLAYGLALFAAVTVGGLGLIQAAGAGLFWIGLAGLLIGWAYSAPPLKLNSRGLGEICVAAGFLLVVAGSAYVQQGYFDALPWIAGLPYALLVTNVLYINQFPDREADRLVGKWHWVVRLEPAVATRGYWLILALAGAALAGGVLAGTLPVWGLLSLLGMVPALQAGRLLVAHAATPGRLAPAIRMTILAAHLQPVILAGILFWSER
ncbi:MAG: prenyltransferase [Pseudomonadota bacterium]